MIAQIQKKLKSCQWWRLSSIQPLRMHCKQKECCENYFENLEELWTGLYSTLSTGGRCIALSTPNGVGNWFHQTCVAALDGKNDFFPTTLPWDVHPDRDEKWFINDRRQ